MWGWGGKGKKKVIKRLNKRVKKIWKWKTLFALSKIGYDFYYYYFN